MAALRRHEAGMTRIDTLLLAGSGLLLLLLAGVPGSESPDARLAQGRVTFDSAFDLARALSQASGHPYGVAIDAEGDRLAVIDSSGRLAIAPDGAATLIDLAAIGLDVEQADFGQGGRTAIYDGDGVPLAGGAVSLRCGEQRLELRLDAATGWLDAVLD